MINFVIGWCLKNRLLVILFTLAITVVGYYALRNTPVDAIPDIGEKQVIVYADWPGRDPKVVEDQVTFPLTVGLQGTPGVKSIRSMSGFGFSMVFVIFQDNVDYYWARSRVLERMNVATQKLPKEVVPDPEAQPRKPQGDRSRESGRRAGRLGRRSEHQVFGASPRGEEFEEPGPTPSPK
jgi:Cu(I)/Ag(I) efflux system membrane protein CusA/SilA